MKAILSSRVLLILVGVSSLVALLALVVALTMVFRMGNQKDGRAVTEWAVPILSVEQVPYTQTDYLGVYVPKGELLKEVAADRLTLIAKTASEEDEKLFRSTVLQVMALDRNLRVTHLCGSTTNRCNGLAFRAELVGARSRFNLQH